MGDGKPTAPLSILLVDDEPLVALRLKPALEKNGYRVVAFEDGAQAVARLAQEDFDIIVTDIRMEPLDGLKVLEAALQRRPHTKVIIITGYATVELAREAMAKGAFEVIAKPFRPNDLREAIDKAVRALKAETA